MEFIKIFFTIIVAALGWLITHYYTSKRDTAISRRTSRINALSTAYKALVRAGLDGRIVYKSRDGIIHNRATPVEDAIALIHLYGNDEQSKMATECANQFQKTGMGSFTDLINSLRKDIRKMLGEEDLIEQPRYLKISIDDKEKTKPQSQMDYR